ncbi:MAG: response regulator [Bdellovibrionales bacterium]|nr:response regulator [Bdellovibrionales bacterium]
MSEQSDELTLTPKERANFTILTVETDRNERQNMRTALKTLGFGGVTDVPSHAAALEKIQERPVTHIIFDAKKTNMPPLEFVPKALEMDPNIIMLPTSFEPSVDDVFELLCLGARGYLCKPFTVDTVDLAIIAATKGEPISDAVKNAKDRNEALVAIMMSSLDKAANIMRQARQFETAKREVPKALRGFRGSADLAATFAKGGPDGLLEALQQFCIDRSQGPATRLGRLRQRLKKKPSARVSA